METIQRKDFQCKFDQCYLIDHGNYLNRFIPIFNHVFFLTLHNPFLTLHNHDEQNAIKIKISRMKGQIQEKNIISSIVNAHIMF